MIERLACQGTLVDCFGPVAGQADAAKPLIGPLPSEHAGDTLPRGRFSSPLREDLPGAERDPESDHHRAECEDEERDQDAGRVAADALDVGNRFPPLPRDARGPSIGRLVTWVSVSMAR